MENAAAPVAMVDTYPLSNYTYGTKQPTTEKHSSLFLSRLQLTYMEEGMRRSVAGILVVHGHNHPHILLLKLTKASKLWRLPGGRLKPGENEIDGLKRKLSSKLGAESPDLQPDWQIGECVSIWWRPNFEANLYPYCPPHITKPKECRKVFIVHLSEKEYFEVPETFNLVAVPLFDLYDNFNRYGLLLSSLPEQLSRFQFNAINP